LREKIKKYNNGIASNKNLFKRKIELEIEKATYIGA
jgi:hypothetical protein